MFRFYIENFFFHYVFVKHFKPWYTYLCKKFLYLILCDKFNFSVLLLKSGLIRVRIKEENERFVLILGPLYVLIFGSFTYSIFFLRFSVNRGKFYISLPVDQHLGFSPPHHVQRRGLGSLLPVTLGDKRLVTKS